jgi:hypothetical protein
MGLLRRTWAAQGYVGGCSDFCLDHIVVLAFAQIWLGHSRGWCGFWAAAAFHFRLERIWLGHSAAMDGGVDLAWAFLRLLRLAAFRFCLERIWLGHSAAMDGQCSIQYVVAAV